MLQDVSFQIINQVGSNHSNVEIALSKKSSGMGRRKMKISAKKSRTASGCSKLVS
jgi:hypothetical protein